jgi:benzoyl-CoA reductase/2-hydroxyglutaryl-CoA dehydratase subunit BcrC/BadD/HgdB
MGVKEVKNEGDIDIMNQAEKESDMSFGWLCSYTPVEILVAAGSIPTRLDAGDMILSETNPYIYQLICPYVRAVFGAAQKESFDPLEGVVFMKCCDAMLRLYDLWKAHLPNQKAYILPLPKIQSKEARKYFADAIRRFSDSLGRDLGVSINEDALRKAVSDVNKLRSAVQRLYQMRLGKPGTMAYSRLRLLIRQWLSRPPAQALREVEKELKDLEGEPAEASPPSARVLVASSTLDQLQIIEMIEQAGMTVVADDHCSGLRHFDRLVREEGDLFLNLAERYLMRWPCSRMQSDPSHFGRVIDEVDRTGAEGVIYVALKYCDHSGFDVPRIQAQLKEKDIPMLYIENDYTVSGLGQLKVRIEAFAEMLREEL